MSDQKQTTRSSPLHVQEGCAEALRLITHSRWIEWQGGSAPVAEYENPEIQYRSGGITEMPANRVRWQHTGAWDDVTAYRIRLPERNNA